MNPPPSVYIQCVDLADHAAQEAFDAAYWEQVTPTGKLEAAVRLARFAWPEAPARLDRAAVRVEPLRR
jgi:hypothetical protein